MQPDKMGILKLLQAQTRFCCVTFIAISYGMMNAVSLLRFKWWLKLGCLVKIMVVNIIEYWQNGGKKEHCEILIHTLGCLSFVLPRIS